MVRPSFKDYFYFNKIERRGVFFLLALIVIIIAANQLLIYFPIKKNNEYSEKEMLAMLSQLEREDSNMQQHEWPKQQLEGEGFHEKEAYFPFNPNETSTAQWMKLGLSKKQAEVIENYKNKGGVFRVKADLAKMYVISEEHYLKLEPFIQLPNHIDKNQMNASKFEEEYAKTKPSYKKWETVVMDINLADSISLLKVYGIGPYYAGKIIAYRNQLGGYSSKKQLLEIWNFTDSMYAALDSSLLISKIKLRKININTAKSEELKGHPYISWNVANSIVNIRKQHGKYRTVEEIKQSVLIDDSTYLKISPYLKVE